MEMTVGNVRPLTSAESQLWKQAHKAKVGRKGGDTPLNMILSGRSAELEALIAGTTNNDTQTTN